MFIKYEKRKDADGNIRTSVRIVESIRHGNKIIQNPVKSFGILELQPDQILFMNEVKRQLDILNEGKDTEIRFRIKVEDNFNRSEINTTFNYGFRYLDPIYDYLKIDKFLNNNLSLDSVSERDKVNEVVKFLTLERILSFGSNKDNCTEIERYYGKSYNFYLDDIYNSLDILYGTMNQLFLHLKDVSEKLILNKAVEKFNGASSYYYTGINHSNLDGLIGIGVSMNKNGIPCDFSMIPNDINNHEILFHEIEKIKRDDKLTRVVVVAGKELNSESSIVNILEMGNGYILKEELKDLNGKRYQDLINNDEIKWIKTFSTSKGTDCKYKLITETINHTYYDDKGNPCNIVIKQKVLVYLELATNNSNYFINKGEYQEQENLDNYSCLITSELDCDFEDIIESYSRLERIKIAFNYSEPSLSSSSSQSNEKHTYSSILISYIGFLVIELFQYKLKISSITLPIERVIKVLNRMKVNKVSDDLVHIFSIAGAKENTIQDENNRVYSNSIIKEQEIWKDYQLINCAFNIKYDKSYDYKKNFDKYLKSILFNS